MKINHNFAVGEEVIFKPFAETRVGPWFTGPGSVNADAYGHFATQGINDCLTANATYSVLGGFEDLNGGGNHNDLMFEFSNVATTPVTATPEPGSIRTHGYGRARLAWSVRRRRKAASQQA